MSDLNASHGIPGTLEFVPGPGGLTVATITNHHASAAIALHGAHVMSYTPAGGQDLLWMSQASLFAAGEPIRGGIPVCWPWFGAHPSDPALPAHGFVRRLSWEVLETVSHLDGTTTLRLGLNDSPATRQFWPYAFGLELAVTIGPQLTVALKMLNPGTEPCPISCALHTYFGVGDVRSVVINGLDGTAYINTVGGKNEECRQTGEIRIAEEVDRVYLDTTAEVTVDVPAQQRRIRIAKQGSRTTVVWNPWITKAAKMPDFGDQEFPEMLCVETANARRNTLTLAPGTSHTITTILSAEPLS